ncbi:ATP-binding protein [Streptomyces roseofulvus]|uniref:ATP-binding protein n=1 Tax=Streptomyces roseofulvus TaxID=33902 RepID=UPI0031FC3592
MSGTDTGGRQGREPASSRPDTHAGTSRSALTSAVQPPDLSSYRFHRVVSVPRLRRQETDPDSTRSQLTAAVTAAHAVLSRVGKETGRKDDSVEDDGGKPVGLAAAWVRPGQHRPLHFLMGGAPWFPPAGIEPPPETVVPLRYPPGATAHTVPPGDIARLLRMPYWVPCTGFHDPLHIDAGGERQRTGGRRGTFDDAVAHLPDAFAWLVLAEPVPYERLERERTDLALRLPHMRRRDSSEADRMAVSRYESRYRELCRARATGMWDVTVLVGAETPGVAHASAALLCAAGDLDELPYVLAPADRIAPPDATLPGGAAEAAQKDGAFTASAELVAALARPPARELPGVRALAPNRFDVTFDTDDRTGLEDGFPVGDVLDEASAPTGTFRLTRATLNRHAFVCGATGSGKSQTVRSLLTALATHRDPVPWLVIEPAKAEYARIAGRLAAAAREDWTPEDRNAKGGDEQGRNTEGRGAPQVGVIRPGAVDVPPASLNPLEPEPGFPLQSHLDLVRALFLACFEGDEPFPQVLSRSLSECYTAAGWDLVTGEPRPVHRPKYLRNEPDVPRAARHPTLGDLQATARRVVETIGYGKEVTDNVRGFVDVRIGSLREGAPGRFFEGGHPLDVGGLLSGNFVLELEALTNDQDKAFLMGAVLIRVVEHLRVHHGGGAVPLRHVLVVEEAHRLLKNVTDGPAAAAVDLFASLLAEIRAYGEGVVIVEQIPTKILPDVIKNSALKIMHRLPAEDDRRAVGGTMNLQDEQSVSVVAFPPGLAAVAADGMDRPVLASMPYGERDESARQASARPPLRGSRSPLCGSSCRDEPCTLRVMNDARHLSAAPLTLVWVEAVATNQAMGMPPPGPSAAVRDDLTGPTPRVLDCALVHAVERAVGARESFMRHEVDAPDFAAHLHTALHGLLRGRWSADEDPRRFAYGGYRFRDVLETIHVALRDDPEGPHTYPAELTAQWAARGLVLTGTSAASHRDQVRTLPGTAAARPHARVGDVARSGLYDAITALTGGVAETHIRRAFTLACAPGRWLEVLMEQSARRLAHELTRKKGTDH